MRKAVKLGRTRSRGEDISSRINSESSPTPAPFFVEKEADRDFEARLNALDELLNTERAYIADLKTVIDKYLIPIRKEEKISVESIAKIFSNIEELYAVHTNIFTQLDDKMSDIQYLQKIEFCVTEIFSQNVDKLKKYTTYSANYKLSIREINTISEKNAQFAQFLEARQKENEYNLRLIDYLIKPIQRLCKYPLIFSNLLKYTPNDHEDREFMIETMDQLEKLTVLVEEHNAATEKSMAISAIAANLSGFEGNLNIAGREVLLDSKAFVGVDKEKLRNRRIILFSDVLIISKALKLKKYSVTDQIPLEYLLVSSTYIEPSPPVSQNNSKPKLRRFGSSSNNSLSTSSSVINYNPELCIQIIDLKVKKKMIILFKTKNEKSEWDEMLKTASETRPERTLSVEEHLKIEKEARIHLQEKNAELVKRIKELEARLEEEIQMRKSYEDKFSL